MAKHLIFVYGSLRSGGAGAMSTRFPDSKFVADASVSGTLYDLGPYPGLLVNDSESPVFGEVYEVDDELLKELDAFEATSNYLRKQVEVAFGDESKMCWTYEPNPDTCHFGPVVTSGDWIEYSRTRVAESK